MLTPTGILLGSYFCCSGKKLGRLMKLWNNICLFETSLFSILAVRTESRLESLVQNGQQGIRRLSQRIRKKSGLDAPKHFRVGGANRNLDPGPGPEIEMDRLGEDIGEDVIRVYRQWGRHLYFRFFDDLNCI